MTTALYARYFASGEMNVAGMSSHWRRYAALTSVRLGATGAPVDAVGVGFGDMNRRRRGNALFTSIAAVLHSAKHPAKGRVPAGIVATVQASRRAGLVFNQDALRQALTFALLAEYLERESVHRILMIGDGYGLLGAVLARWRSNAQVVFVDLGRSLLFQAITCSRLFPDASHALIGDADETIAAASRFIYCPADRLSQWCPVPVDLAVNIASMQEMSSGVVQEYFALMRRAPARWFYCCNRDRKVMPAGEVSDFMSYPWHPADQHVIDGHCPWHQWYVAPLRGRQGFPFSLRAPYDGPHLHRLTRLAPLA